jgi:hypothetical protein
MILYTQIFHILWCRTDCYLPIFPRNPIRAKEKKTKKREEVKPAGARKPVETAQTSNPAKCHTAILNTPPSDSHECESPTPPHPHPISPPPVANPECSATKPRHRRQAAPQQRHHLEAPTVKTISPPARAGQPSLLSPPWVRPRSRASLAISRPDQNLPKPKRTG